MGDIAPILPPEMKVAMWKGGPLIAIETIATPRPLAPHELLVKVRAAFFGAALRRAMRVGHPHWKPPRVLGSLFAGDVVAVGDGLGNPGVGTPIVVDPHPPCGECVPCRMDRGELCRASIPIYPGALAEYVLLPERLAQHVRIIPSTVSYSHAALTEIVACCISAMNKTSVQAGSQVVIVGGGPTAGVLIQLAHLRGARTVICVHRHPERRPMIQGLGAVALESTTDVPAAVSEILGSEGAQYVFEAVGSADTYELCQSLVAPGGTIVAFGGCPPSTQLTLDINRLHYSGITLVGSYHYPPGTFTEALALLGASAIRLDRIVTHELRFDRIDTVLQPTELPDCIAATVMFEEDTL